MAGSTSEEGKLAGFKDFYGKFVKENLKVLSIFCEEKFEGFKYFYGHFVKENSKVLRILRIFCEGKFETFNDIPKRKV